MVGFRVWGCCKVGRGLGQNIQGRFRDVYTAG